MVSVSFSNKGCGSLSGVSLRQELLPVKEVAKWLGIKVSTIYSWVHYRKIPFTKVNGGLRFEYGQILKFIEDSRN